MNTDFTEGNKGNKAEPTERLGTADARQELEALPAGTCELSARGKLQPRRAAECAPYLAVGADLTLGVRMRWARWSSWNMGSHISRARTLPSWTRSQRPMG